MELPIKLSKDSREPIYHQVESQLKALIASGQLQAGSPLPSIRVLSKMLEISVITTRRAYQNLEQHGFIETIQGKGTFVKVIAEHDKEELKAKTVYDTFTVAIETAIRYDYTFEQINLIFQEVIQQIKEREEHQ